MRRRAPKLDRSGDGEQLSRKRSPAPSLPRLRRGEIPGIRHDSHPYLTVVLVALGVIGTLLPPIRLVPVQDLLVMGPIHQHWWLLLTSPFVYFSAGYAFVALTVTAIYGTLLERRHGHLPVVVLALVGGAGGMAVASQAYAAGLVTGGNGIALALLVAWVIPDLLALRRGEEPDGDLIATGVLAVVVALMPLATPGANWITEAVGAVAGLLIGFPLARLHSS